MKWIIVKILNVFGLKKLASKVSTSSGWFFYEYEMSEELKECLKN